MMDSRFACFYVRAINIRAIATFIFAVLSVVSSSLVYSHTLSGTIYLEATPLSNTTITVINTVNDDVVTTTLTNSVGGYAIDLDNGLYDFTITPTASLGLSQSIVEAVEINSTDLTYHVVLIEPELMLSGNVSGLSGTPASGVRLTIYNQATNQNAGVFTTNETGAYSFALAKGTYRIIANGVGRDSNLLLPEIWSITPISSDLILNGDSTHDLQIPNVTVSGLIQDSNSNNVANTIMRLQTSWTTAGISYYVNNNGGTIKSNTDGFYELPVFNWNNYSVSVLPSLDTGLASKSVSIIFAENSISQNIVLVDASILSGRLSSPVGIALKGVEVYLFDQDSSVSMGSTISNNAGYYEFPVSTGTYKINVGGSGVNNNLNFPDRWYINSMVSDILVTGNMLRDITVPIVSLTTKFVNGLGQPVSGVSVDFDEIWEGSESLYSASASNNRFISDADGNVSLTLITHDDYDFTFDVGDSTVYAETLRDDVDMSDDQSLEIIIKDSHPLTGSLLLPNGNPVENAKLSFYSLQSGLKAADVTTDSNGFYQLSLASGSYRLDIRGRDYDVNSGLPQNWFMGSAVNNLEIPTITVQDIVLPVTRVRGTVYDSNGQTVSNVNIAVNEGWSNISNQRFVINNTGNYASTNTVGEYSFYVFDYDDYTFTLLPPDGVQLVAENYNNINVVEDAINDFSFSPTQLLHGKVVTPEGNIVSGVKLSIYDANTNLTINNVTSNASGEYQFSVIAGDYYIHASGNGASSNIDLPGYWHIRPLVTTFGISTDILQDIVLPVATLSGKATDSNGVPVAGVEFQVVQTWRDGDTDYRVQAHSGYYVTESGGDYTMALFVADNYRETIIPPVGSGFNTVIINDLPLPDSSKQNVVLVYPDAQAPVIIAGPYVNNITDTEAVVVWQTDEPASSSVLLSGNGLSATITATSDFVTDHSVHVTDLNPATVYGVIAISSDQHGNGPTESQVIEFTTSLIPTNQTPVIIGGPIVTAITDTSALVEWQTNEPTTSELQFGLSVLDPSQANELTDTQTNIEYTTQHSMRLNNLSAASRYAIRVSSTNASGTGSTQSRIVDFTTQITADSTAPVIIAGPMVIDITSSSATVVWTTDEPAISGVSYNDGVAHGVLNETVLTTTHSMHIPNLQADALYHVTVSSKDRHGNGPSISAGSSFVTLALTDNQPPVFTVEPVVVVTTDQSAVIRWDTNEPADSVIEYGFAEDNLIQTNRSAALVSTHNLAIVGLEPSRDYYFRVYSTDAAGNQSASAVNSFFTSNGQGNVSPTIVTGPTVTGKTDTTISLSWETEQAVVSIVEFIADDSSKKRVNSSEYAKFHTVTITGLSSDNYYQYTVDAVDFSGNVTSVNQSGAVLSTAIETDSQAPSLTGDVTIDTINDTTIAINWQTNELATTYIIYNVRDQDLTRVSGDLEFATQHRVVLTNLDSGTPYQYKIIAVDVAGNRYQQSNAADFTTGFDNDNTAPELSGINANHITYSSAKIDWLSNEFTLATLDYGLSATNLDTSIENNEYNLAHSQDLQSLGRGITYYYQVTVVDMAGNQTISEVYSFTTPGTAVDIDNNGVADVLETNSNSNGRGQAGVTQVNNGSTGGGGMSFYYLILLSLFMSLHKVWHRRHNSAVGLISLKW